MSQLPIPLSSQSFGMAALGLVCLVLALLFTLLGLAWGRQRSALRSARHEAHGLRAELLALQQQSRATDAAVQQSALVGFRCGGAFDGPVLSIGAGIEPLCGLPALAFTTQGQRLIDIVHPEDRPQVQARLQQRPKDAMAVAVEFRVLQRAGRSLWVAAQCFFDLGSDGMASVSGTLLDVDRYRAPLQQLQQRSELHDALVAHIPGMAYRCTPDDNWTVQFISESVLQLSGWSQADYLASPALLRELVDAEDLQRVSREVQAAIDENRSFTLEYRARHRDGRVFWAREHGRAVRDADGRVLWLDGVVIDISERHTMELALREARKLAEEATASKAAFLSNMGHEVRTPLNAIIGFSEIVLRNELDTLQRQYVYKVRQAATALLRLMNDLLDMAKLERSQLQCASVDFSLRQVAQQALAAQHDAAEHKGLALRLDTEPGLPEFFQGDAARLRQILDKLLDNALKFTERGTVRLQLARQQGQMLLAVHDTGIGIALHDQARIFEAFAQADVSASRRFGGTGLGITLARQLVERMGGSLTLHSVPGQGSVFRVLVPLADAATPHAAADTAPPQHRDVLLPAGLQALFDASPASEQQPWHDSLRATVVALRNGDHGDAALPALLQSLRGHGLTQHVDQVEHALARFDLDRAAELLETLPARL